MVGRTGRWAPGSTRAPPGTPAAPNPQVEGTQREFFLGHRNPPQVLKIRL